MSPPLPPRIPSHHLPLSHFNHSAHVAHCSGISQQCISRCGWFSLPVLEHLCTADHIQNNTDSFPLQLCAFSNTQGCFTTQYLCIWQPYFQKCPTPLVCGKTFAKLLNSFFLWSLPDFLGRVHHSLWAVSPHCSCFYGITSHGWVLYEATDQKRGVLDSFQTLHIWCLAERHWINV